MTAIGFALLGVMTLVAIGFGDEIKSEKAKFLCGFIVLIALALMLAGVSAMLWRLAP